MRGREEGEGRDEDSRAVSERGGALSICERAIERCEEASVRARDRRGVDNVDELEGPGAARGDKCLRMR